MAKVIVGTTMSLDGFMNDRHGSVERLYPDLEALRQTEWLQEEIRTTGAVVMGRHAYDMAQGDLTGYEFQVPIFVVTHHVPGQAAKGENDKLRLHFVTDGLASAVQQAKDAAGEKNVMVIGGASIAQQIIRAGLADEIKVGIVPVLLGGGLRFFEQLDGEPIELENTALIEATDRIDLTFRVRKAGRHDGR